MTQNYYRLLNVPYTLFDKEQVENICAEAIKQRNNSAGTQINFRGRKNSLFNDVAHDWIKSLGCEIMASTIFYSQPRNTTPTILGWHNDGEYGDYTKFNFIWGSTNHLMLFGEPTGPYPEPVVNRAGTRYTSFKENELKNIVSLQIDKPIIFNGNIPHEIRNFDHNSRWCLSMVINYNGNRLLWNDALNIFKDYIIE